MITERELATILAALRYWQINDMQPDAIMDVATDDGQFTPLSDAEIDVLAERLNFGHTE